MDEKIRQRRLHLNDRADDSRTKYQRDRDRILYTGALRRLAGTTQVVSEASGRNFHLSHNRLTHTLEVAQIARRIAEYQSEAPPKLLEAVIGAVEADTYEPPWTGRTFMPIGRYEVKSEDGQVQRRPATVVFKQKRSL